MKLSYPTDKYVFFLFLLLLLLALIFLSFFVNLADRGESDKCYKLQIWYTSSGSLLATKA